MRVWSTIVVAFLSLGLASCADMSSEAFDNQLVEEDFRTEAELRLFNHDIQGAHAVYTRALSDMPYDSTAATGEAVTRLLLLPYSAHVTRIFRENLEATTTMNISDNAIYGDGGVFYLLARGVDFQDGENYPGILSLLDDKLPWASSRFESPTSFFGVMGRSLNELSDNLQPVAVELEEIQAGLAIAGQDEEFGAFLVPGEVFHNDTFNLVLNRTELLALDGILSLVRSGIHFAGAYSWDLTLKAVFNEEFVNLSAEDPRYVEGWLQEDYQADMMSKALLREVRNPQRLLQASNALGQAFGAFKRAVEVGIQERSNDILTWRGVSDTLAQELATFLGALEASVSERTVLPYMSPQTSLDLGALFNGRVLATEIEWFVRDELDGVILNDEALRVIGVEGLFDPEFDIDTPPELQLSEDSTELTSQIVGDFQDEVRISYF